MTLFLFNLWTDKEIRLLLFFIYSMVITKDKRRKKARKCFHDVDNILEIGRL